MKTESEIKKDALIMGLLYSVFGFMGVGIFWMWGIYLPSQTPEIKMPLVFQIMVYIPLLVGLGMFWFSWKVYKWNLKSDREFYALFKHEQPNHEAVK